MIGAGLVTKLVGSTPPLPPTDRPARSLVVICHPRPDSLTRAALARVLAGLSARGDDVKLIDLDAESFDAREGDTTGNHEPWLGWADRVILVHPTWFSGHPARLAGWFETLWIRPAQRGAKRRTNLLSLETVTSHGSPRWVNRIQAETGLRLMSRVLRHHAHPRCRLRRSAIYDLDRQGPSGIATWLDHLESRYASPDW